MYYSKTYVSECDIQNNRITNLCGNYQISKRCEHSRCKHCKHLGFKNEHVIMGHLARARAVLRRAADSLCDHSSVITTNKPVLLHTC